MPPLTIREEYKHSKKLKKEEEEWEKYGHLPKLSNSIKKSQTLKYGKHHYRLRTFVRMMEATQRERTSLKTGPKFNHWKMASVLVLLLLKLKTCEFTTYSTILFYFISE